MRKCALEKSAEIGPQGRVEARRAGREGSGVSFDTTAFHGRLRTRPI